MKLDVKIQKDTNDLVKRYGLTDQRMDEVQAFVDGLFDGVKKDGIDKVVVIEKVIEFANSTVEAVIIYGWFESRYNKEQNNPLVALVSALRK